METQILIVMQSTDMEQVNSVEELILAQNQLKIIDQGYQDLKLQTPEWIMDKLGETGHEIEVQRLQGVYTKVDSDDRVFSFECVVTGGELMSSGEADKHEREIPEGR